jgi:hypothetical protein
VITLPYQVDKCILLLQESESFFGQFNSERIEHRPNWSTTAKLKELQTKPKNYHEY